MVSKKFIGNKCYNSLSSKTELISIDEHIRIPLSVSEYKILSYFIDHANKPVYLEELAQYIWGAHADEKDPNSLKSQISRVRSKLDQIQKGLKSCIDTNFGLNSYTLKIDITSTALLDDVSDHYNDFNVVTITSTDDHNVLRFENDRFTEVKPASYFDLRKLGYSNIDIATSLINNDIKLYGDYFRGKNVPLEYEGTPEQWAEYLSSVPESFKYVINDKNEIVGNFSFVSITDEQELEFKNGKFIEYYFNPALTRDLFCAGNDHILFLLNLSLNEEYSTIKNNTLLRKMFLEQLLLFAQEDVLFKKIIVNVFKQSHEAFFKEWGFKFIGENANTGKIYELNLIPYPEQLYQQLNRNRHFQDVNEKLKALYT